MTKAKADKKQPFEWLPRDNLLPFPFMCLVLTQDELDAAVSVFDKTERLSFPESGAKAYQFSKKKLDIACIVALAEPYQRGFIETCGLLIHEAVHVWQWFAADIGEERPGDEQEAYAIQVIAQRLIAEYERRLKMHDKRKKGK